MKSYWDLEPQVCWWITQAEQHGNSARWWMQCAGEAYALDAANSAAYSLAREAGHYAGLVITFAELMAAER